MWDITMQFQFATLISFSFVLKSFFVVTMVIEAGSRIFLVLEVFEVPSEEKVWFSILGIMSELDEHKGWFDSRILFFLIQEHPSFIQIFLMTFAKFFANWVVPEKFKWSHLIPMCRLVIFVLSTTSVFNWRRWFVSWLTVNPAFPSSDLTVHAEIFTLQSGTWSVTIFFEFSNWFKISLDVNLLSSFVPAWIIKWLGFFLIIDMSLCRISSTFAPGKFRTFTTWFFLRNLSSIIPFIIESYDNCYYYQSPGNVQ